MGTGLAPSTTLQAHPDQQAAAYIQSILTQHQGVRVEAAPSMGIERTTLYRLMSVMASRDLRPARHSPH